MAIFYEPQQIRTCNPKTDDFAESVFYHGNGYMGSRGFSCEDESLRPHQKGIYMAGIFDVLKPGITDMVNTPNFFPMTAEVDKKSLAAADLIEDFSQSLNLKDGLFSRQYIAVLGEKRLRINISRFISMDDIHTACARLELTPLNFSGQITLKASIDGESCNLPIQDDQVKKNTETVRYLSVLSSVPLSMGGLMIFETKTTRIRICQAFGVKTSENVDQFNQVICKGERSLGLCITFDVKRGELYAADKIITVFSSRECAQNKLKDISLNRLNENLGQGYDQLFEKHRKTLANRWSTADIEIKGDVKAQCAVRYNIFQMMGNIHRGDSRVSIGARGLTHPRYKGCYFWDTEIFMLPFFLYTDPEAAKNLLLYRFNTLDAAREHAKKMSSKGARYPWMTSYDGSEQCESWDIGACEVHVTADVAYALDHYVRVTGDQDFLLDYAAEIYIETARFWESRLSYDKETDRYNMLFVKGPDEYCGATQNNTYTNWLAAYNLELAAASVEFLKNHAPMRFKDLVQKLKLKPDEPEKWREIRMKLPILYDSVKELFLQDETFMLLEPLDISSYKTDNTPLYHKICFDRLQRYRVLKQADLVLLMTLFPDRFTEKQKQAVWDFYEPLTLHDSSLSYGVHALLAAQLKLKDKAWDYFVKSLYLDLENIMENTGGEGLHVAAFGATWQALVFGFSGLRINGKDIEISPNLPEHWESLSFTVMHKGRKFRIHIDHGSSKVEEADESMDKSAKAVRH